MSRAKLVVCTICGNEAVWIKQWAESLLPVVDLFILNLTQYDDNTEELLRQYIPEDKLILVKFPWENNFSSARNKLWEYVPDDTDYIFYIDMDEVLLPSSIPALEEVLNSDVRPVIITTIYNKVADGSGSQRAVLYYPRIFPWKKSNGEKTGPYFEAEVHNQLMFSNLSEKEMMLSRPNILIDHFGYALSPEKMAQKHIRTETLLRNQIAKDNDDFFAWVNLAQLLRAKGDYPGTEIAARNVIRIVEPLVKTEPKYMDAYLMALEQVTTALTVLQKYDEAIKYGEIAIALKPDYLDAVLNMGNCYAELGNFEKAEYWYKRYLLVRSRYNEQTDMTNIILNHLNSSMVVWYHLGMIYGITNRYNEAIEAFMKCYKEEPFFRDVFFQYMRCLEKLGDMKKFNSELHNFMLEHPDNQYRAYEYLADLCLSNCEIESCKFNLYQALFVNGETEGNKKHLDSIRNRWDSMSRVFGPVSTTYFDTSQTKANLDSIVS